MLHRGEYRVYTSPKGEKMKLALLTKGRNLVLLIVIVICVLFFITLGIISLLEITSIHIDNPRFSESEVIALVKRDLTTLGVEGHEIESVDYLSSIQYAGDGEWQGEAWVSYSYLGSSRVRLEGGRIFLKTHHQPKL